MNEKAIIKRCQNGDKAAFDELIRFFYPYVSKYLLKITSNSDITEDLTQETFVKIIRTIDTYDINGRATFATYIITVAKNCYIDYCRKHKEIFTDISEIDIGDSKNLEDQVVNRLEYEQVIQYINGLPPNQQQAIKLKYINELTLNEIAEITGVPSKTVKSRIHEGTKKLRNLLKIRKE